MSNRSLLCRLLPILLLTGCQLFTKSNANTVLDVSKAACIVANAFQPPALVQTICGVVENEVEPMKTLINQTQKTAAAHAPAGCPGSKP